MELSLFQQAVHIMHLALCVQNGGMHHLRVLISRVLRKLVFSEDGTKTTDRSRPDQSVVCRVLEEVSKFSGQQPSLSGILVPVLHAMRWGVLKWCAGRLLLQPSDQLFKYVVRRVHFTRHQNEIKKSMLNKQPSELSVGARKIL